MNDDTIELLKECNSGCKNATNSMEQVSSYIQDPNFKDLLLKYNQKHIDIGDQCHILLNHANESEKDPALMSKVFARFTTDAKLMINDDTAKIAELMVDGCNMGIKSISKVLNKCRNASAESTRLAKSLISIEQDFMDNLLIYL